jgi:hypothetical protein
MEREKYRGIKRVIERSLLIYNYLSEFRLVTCLPQAGS